MSLLASIVLCGCPGAGSESAVDVPDPSESGETDSAEAGDTDSVETGDTDSVETGDTDSAPPEESGSAPQHLVLLATADARLLGESAEDEAGTMVAGAGDPDGDGLADVLVVASESDRAGEDRGAAYLVAGPVTGERNLGTATAIVTPGSDQEDIGLATGLGDLDGDGLGEVAVATPGTTTQHGAISILRGPLVGEVSLESAPWSLLAEDAGDQAGSALAGGVDLDGDLVPDLVAGARNYDHGAGSVYVVSGVAITTSGGPLPLSTAAAIWRAEGDDDGAGGALAAGDVDGDGLGDLLIGADDHADFLGAAYLVLGPGGGEHDLADADTRLLGLDAYDMAGTTVAISPDLDGDGGADLVVGTLREHGGEGLVWVVPGSVRGDSVAADVATVTLVGNHQNDLFGAGVAAAGDLDGDGAHDLLVGAVMDDPGLGWVGSVFGFIGPLAGTLSGRDAALKYGGEGEHWLGHDVAGPGDVDGDGRDDVLIGDARADGAAEGSGVAYLVFGGGA